MRPLRAVRVALVSVGAVGLLRFVVGCSAVLGVDELSAGGPDGSTLEQTGVRSGSGGCEFPTDCALPTTTPADCAEATCDQGECHYRTRDNDGDGHRAAQCKASDDVEITTGDDCDDTKSALFPGGPGIDCAASATGAQITFPGGTPAGACRFGKQTCNADGSLGACVGAVGPQAETTCTTDIDEDCDGNNFTGCTCTQGQSQSCGKSGNGPCKMGKTSCQANGLYGPCEGSVDPGPKNCGGDTDSDCNGYLDKQETSCECPGGVNPGGTRPCNTHPGRDGTGVCKAGAQTCTGSGTTANWSACAGDVGPTTERCDAKDYDCNGVAGVDEPAPAPPGGTTNCSHLYRCSDPGKVRGFTRGGIYYRTNIGFTMYEGSGTQWTAYAPQGTSASHPAGAYPLARNSSSGKLMGPKSVACCGASGCDETLFPPGGGSGVIFYTAP
jgi:hypothetical protein